MQRTLYVSEKTGFKNNTPDVPIIIRDFRGVLFYSTVWLNKPVYNFNLPPGKYMVDQGSFTQMSKPVKYKLAGLPRPERFFPSPFKFDVKFGKNINKCSILWDQKIILFDNQFKESPLPILDFMLFHEFGHELYSTETLADQLSANYMKRRGYNPSQIGDAPISTLSERQIQRMQNVVDALIKTR